MPVITAVVSVATSIGTWFAGLSVAAATLVQLGAGVLLNLIGAELLAPDIQKPGISGKIGSTEDTPRSVIFGEYATRGSLVYHITWGKAGDHHNAYYTRITAVSDLPVKGLKTVWVDGRKCRLDWRRAGIYGAGTPLVEFTSPSVSATYDDETGYWRDENGLIFNPDVTGNGELKAFAWVRFHDGTQTAADEFMLNEVQNAAYPWGADAVGFGVAYAITTFRFSDTYFRGLPDVIFEVSGVPLVNPVTGQAGTDDENPIVQAAAIVAGLRYGDQWLYGPQGPAAGRILPDGLDWQIAACNVPVPGADEMTSEERVAAFGSDQIPARYRSGYEVRCDQEAPDVLKEILKAANGRFIDLGDCVRFQVGDPTDAGATITDDDILVTRPRSKVPFGSLADLVNGVRAIYPEPSAGWEVQDAPALYFPVLEALDDGRRLPSDVQLNAVPYAEQVQRLMQITVLEGRREIRHEIELPAPFDGLEAGDFVDWTSAQFGYDAKRFRVVQSVPSGGAALSVSLVEADPSDYVAWNAATDFVNRDRRLVPVDPEPYQIGDDEWSVAGGAVENDGRRAIKPALVISWPEITGLVAIEWRAFVVTTDEPAAAGAVYAPGAGSLKVSEGIVPAVPYRVEIRARFAGGVENLWSVPKVVIAPDFKPALLDLADDVSGAIDDAAQSAEADKLAAEGARDLALGYRDGALTAQGAAETARDSAAESRDFAAALAVNNLIGKSAFDDGSAAGWSPSSFVEVVPAPEGHPLGRTLAMHLKNRDAYFSPNGGNVFIERPAHGRTFRFRGYAYCDGDFNASIGIHSVAALGQSSWAGALASRPGEGWQYFDVLRTVSDPDGARFRPWLTSSGPHNHSGNSVYWTDLVCEDVTERLATEAARDLALGYRDGALTAKGDAEAARDQTLGYRDGALTAQGAAEGARDLALGYRDGALTAKGDAETARDQTLGRLDAAIVFREGANGLELAPGTDVAGGASPSVRASAGAILSGQSIGRDLLEAYIAGARVFAQTPGGQSIGAGAMNWTEVQRVVVDPEGMPVQFQISALLRKITGTDSKRAHVRFRRGLSAVLFTTAGYNGSRGFVLPNDAFVTFATTATDDAGLTGAQNYILEVAREDNWSADFEVNGATISAKVEAI